MTKNAINPTREEDFNEWYQQVVYAAQLAEHSPVRGCMVIKPWGYAIWERMHSVLDKAFKKKGVENIYCPLLIPVSFLEKEAAHVKGFAKECAVVTHHRLGVDKDGSIVPEGPLTEPYVIRPTSEAMMGHIFAQWIQSYRDLPLKINQWANVMRWEMRPRLFLRTSEFLWQEGHTAHASAQEAEELAYEMIEAYKNFLEGMLAIPVILGRKSDTERFAGADTTWTVEAIMQDGKALQAGTSHFLGQHFAKAFDIQFVSSDNTPSHVWTTSWGVSTRMIGGLVMSHSDDDGLVLPASIAPYQIVIIPILPSTDDAEALLGFCRRIEEQLANVHFSGDALRIHVDTRNMSHSAKKWDWIKKGLPLRIEVGMKEVQAGTVMLKWRHDLQTGVSLSVEALLLQISADLAMYQEHVWKKALSRHHASIKRIDTASVWQNCDKDYAGLYLVPWAGDDADEALLAQYAWTIRCMLPGSHALIEQDEAVCVVTGKTTDYWAVIGKSY